MSENYTAEYFAQETLATRGKYNYARRIASDGPEPWRDGGRIWRSDAQLAAEGWTPVVESRITLDGLAGAWEAAEVPTDDAPMRQGDVYISTVDRNDRGLGYLVAAAGRNGRHMHFNARVLSRAPKREPWADLADVLRAWDAEPADADADGMAKWFHERGVRVTGGDGDE